MFLKGYCYPTNQIRNDLPMFQGMLIFFLHIFHVGIVR